MTIYGEAQGTTYQVSWVSEEVTELRSSVDSIFRKIDSSLSTYLSSSIISRINRNENGVVPDEHFIRVFEKSMEVSEKTGGAFDVTVAPLVNAWGFGFTEKTYVDSMKIDSLLLLTGYKKVKLDRLKDFPEVIKQNPGIMLDFNAIAQGYTVDVIAAFLDRKNIKHYFIELGGEVRAEGKKNNDVAWRVGIDKPEEDQTGERHLQAVLSLENRSLATSGNYRKFYEQEGQKFSHIIDPFSGYPAKNNLLSVSVVADDCMTADAYATAFMVMGLEKAKLFLSGNIEQGLDVFFIYDDNGKWKTFISEGLNSKIEELN